MGDSMRCAANMRAAARMAPSRLVPDQDLAVDVGRSRGSRQTAAVGTEDRLADERQFAAQALYDPP
jgi:hypothetical protein